MKITSIETFATRDVCLVRLRTEDGVEGFGQTAPYNADITAQVLHRQIVPNALGADDGDIGSLIEGCIRAQHKFPWSYVCRAACGVETALWDIRGKREGKAVCELFGREPGPVDVYGSSMRRDIKPSDEADRLARLKAEHGYRAFKLHVAVPNSGGRDVYPGRTEEILPLVRRAIGDDCELYMDPNGAYTPEGALRIARVYQDHGVDFFEEPCPFWEIEQIAEVAHALDMPVAAGEQDNSLAQWRRIFALRAVDIAQPDIGYIGGLSRVLEVARMGAEKGVRTSPHTANRSLLTVFGLHIMRILQDPFPFLEHSIEETPWVEDLYEPKPDVRGGRVSCPAEPGWGVRINEAWLEKAEHKESAL
jgi:L-alanine-DL-glutamate epimerase-like enolase superfamily enzyme